MRDNTRLIATLIIWIGFTIMVSTITTSVTGPVASGNSATIFGIVLVLALTALIGTLAVWVGGGRSGAAEDLARTAKAKRTTRNRVERLVETLEDDEVYELDALLLAREEEHQRH